MRVKLAWFGLLMASPILTACGPPPDAAMVRKFAAHRAEFEELRNTACALGRNQIIRPDRADPEIPEAQASEFRGKLREIGASGLNVSMTSRGCDLVLDVWSSGFAGTPASYKQFRYGPPPEVGPNNIKTQILSNLDRINLPDEIVQFVRPLGNGWWIEYVSYP